MSDTTNDMTMQQKAQSHDLCFLFTRELLDSVETLTGIAQSHGASTLAHLMYLQSAIVSGGFIEYYEGESEVLKIVNDLPSGERWLKFIRIADLSEEQGAYINRYSHCGQSWSDESASTNNDRCPICRAEIEPYASEDLTVATDESRSYGPHYRA